MANLLQSSQTQATTAPGFYTDYLGNIASGATKAIDPTTGAQFVGAQPLQEKAFAGVEGAAGAYKPTLESAGTTLGTAATAASPLSAASPYLSTASGDVGAAASGLMNPYTANVVNSIADIGQRNIMQNLAPQATAGAVGSGQFGSKRGAEVLGQTIQNANKDILNQQYQALNTGYNTALQTALQKQQLEGQMGATAGNLASAGQQNLTAAGRAQAELAKANQELGLADINALATLGEQQRTLKQNEELFPLSNLATASSLLRGYNVPTTTKTTMDMSPLSALAGVGTGALGLFTPGAGGTTPFENIKSAYSKMFPGIKTTSGGSSGTSVSQEGAVAAAENQGYTIDPAGSGYLIKDGNYYAFDANNNPVLVGPIGEFQTDNTGTTDETDFYTPIQEPEGSEPYVPPDYTTDLEEPTDDYARGGLISLATGGPAGAWSTSLTPRMNIGGLPAGNMPQYDQSNTYVGYNDTDGNFVQR